MAKDMRPHVLLFPLPAQGHISPMLNLAELLSKSDLYVTFLNTEHTQQSISRTSGDLRRLALIPTFRFRTIPDGLPKEDPQTSLRLMAIMEYISTRCREEYKDGLLNSIDGWPPVTCVVADGLFPFALDVAEEMKIPTMIMRTSSACSIWAYYCIPELLKSGELPFKDEDDLDKIIHSVTGMESFLRHRDLPGLIRKAKSVDDFFLQFLMAVSRNLTRASALILNTVEKLEAPVLSQIRDVCPITYSLGPLHTFVKSFGPHNRGIHENTLGTNQLSPNSASLWQEDRTCLTWLNSQPPKSVVYVSFGSVTVMSGETFLEFWYGLVNSGYRFLWAVRPDLLEAKTTESVTPPPEIEEATRKRGCLAAWAPQQEVLAHPAVGCFLTHSGWNSTLESITAGVPMICWPFIGDQYINSRFVSEVWKIGMDMKDLCARSVVERMVREVMDGEKANEIRRAVGEMSEMAKDSTEDGGSSCQDLKRLVQHIKALSATRNE